MPTYTPNISETPYDILQQLMDRVLGKVAPPSKYDAPDTPYKYPGRRSESEMTPFSRDLPTEPEPTYGKDIFNALVEGLGDPMNMMNPMRLPAVGLVKGGQITNKLLPKIGSHARNVGGQQFGSVKSVGPAIKGNLYGEPLTEQQALWTNPLQTLMPASGNKKLTAFQFNNPQPPGTQKLNPDGSLKQHFGDFHSSSVSTDRPLHFVEELQSEASPAFHDNPPSSQAMEAIEKLKKSTRSSTTSSFGLPDQLWPPWATDSRITLYRNLAPDASHYRDNLLRNHILDGYNRSHQPGDAHNVTSIRSMTDEHKTNIYNKLALETKEKLFRLPDWVQEHAKDYITAMQSGGKLRPTGRESEHLDSISRKFMEMYELDGALSPEKKTALYNYMDASSKASFNWQPIPLENILSPTELAEAISPVGRVTHFVDQMTEGYNKLKGVVEPSPIIAPKAPNILYPWMGRSNQANYAMQRSMAEADRNKEVWALIADPSIRGGHDFNYAYGLDQGSSPNSAIRQYMKANPHGEDALAPESLRLTTTRGEGGPHSHGPRELRRMLDQGVKEAGEGGNRDVQHWLENGLEVQSKRLSHPITDRPMFGGGDLWNMNIPVHMREKDIDLATKLGMRTRGKQADVRPNLYQDAIGYKRQASEKEALEKSQLFEAILRSNNPKEMAKRLNISLSDLTRQMGGARGQFTKQEMNHLIDSIKHGHGEALMADELRNVQPEVQAALLANRDPFSANARIENWMAREARSGRNIPVDTGPREPIQNFEEEIMRLLGMLPPGGRR
jgi:hypothetical protein